MTVRKLKEILEKYPDNYRIVVDYGDPADGATEDNEIVDYYSLTKPHTQTIIFQTRDDFDYEYELECRLKEWAEDDSVDEDWVIAELYDLGYTYRDLTFDLSAYGWAMLYAEDHGYDEITIEDLNEYKEYLIKLANGRDITELDEYDVYDVAYEKVCR